MITYREATLEDEELVMEFYETYDDTSYNLKYFAKKYFNGFDTYEVYMFFNGEDHVACMSTYNINNVCVVAGALCKPEYRNNGVVKCMAKAYYESAVKNNSKKIGFVVGINSNFIIKTKRLSEGYTVSVGRCGFENYTINTTTLSGVVEGY